MNKKIIWGIVVVVVIGAGVYCYAFKNKVDLIAPVIECPQGQVYQGSECIVPEPGTTNSNMSGGKNVLPFIAVLTPNGGENIPYGSIQMAGDLNFTWKTSLGTNYKPTSEFFASIVDENGAIVRNDQTNSKTNTGNGIFASSFVGENKIQVNKKYKIRVCDEIEARKVTCDESDDYFIITN